MPEENSEFHVKQAIDPTTPEFKAAVAAAAAQAKDEILAALKDVGGNPTGESAVDLLRQLALSIAEVSHQGDKRDKPVDPRILAEREAAHERMVALLMEARTLPEKPRYRAISKLFFNERMILPFRREGNKAVPVEFSWTGAPNHAMRPLNAIAEKIYAAFRASCGDKVEKSNNKPLWMTDKGLVIQGDPPARREVAAVPNFDADLDIPQNIDPEAPFVHVLGTVAAPAMQNYHGKTI